MAWSTLTLVAMPTAAPASLAHTAMEVMGVMLSGSTPTGVVIRLATGGQCGTAGGRVGNAVAVALGVDERDVGEAREGERFDAAAPFDGGEIGLGGVDLVHAHAVADEVKDVLRPFLGEGSGGKGQT